MASQPITKKTPKLPQPQTRLLSLQIEQEITQETGSNHGNIPERPRYKEKENRKDKRKLASPAGDAPE
jgi:hypothetical protein